MIGLVDADPCRGEELDSPDGRNRRIHELEERLTRLNRASLRITRDLCLDSMLQGVIDSARSLTSSRYGVTCRLG